VARLLNMAADDAHACADALESIHARVAEATALILRCAAVPGFANPQVYDGISACHEVMREIDRMRTAMAGLSEQAHGPSIVGEVPAQAAA